MNYLRGAVNAISAPYQYYRDLPPLNPSTLTGAIDVIVIKRPADSGDLELACSPFHVRFGKWQVLRPGAKKVNVSVNGHPIPFNMKIGEAGEAFFIFETDEDIPEDLITSPLLEATRPEGAEANDTDTSTERFDAQQGDDVDLGIETTQAAQEPEFLDLNASADSQDPSPSQDMTFHQVRHPKELSGISKSRPAQSLPSPPPSPSPSSSLLSAQSGSKMTEKADEAVESLLRQVDEPIIRYTQDVVLDSAGYHSQGRERSDGTIRNDLDFRTPSPPSSPIHTPQQRSHELPFANDIPFPTSSTSSTSAYSLSRKDKPNFKSQAAICLPSDRHIDTDSEYHVSKSLEEVKTQSLGLNDMPIQEYSWEWGAFPQPSPIKTSFKDGRWDTLVKGKAKARLPAVLDSDDEMSKDDDRDMDDSLDIFRSKSVPLELEGSPSLKRKELKGGGEFGYGDVDVDAEVDVVLNRIKGSQMGGLRQDDETRYGDGGRLTASSGDSTRFGVFIEGRTVQFEISMVDHGGREGGVAKVFDGSNEVEAASIFEKGKVEYQIFLDDEDMVKDDRLVIRWAGDQYITRSDGSPLMDALILWRDVAIEQRINGIPLPVPPPSPSPSLLVSDDEDSGITDKGQAYNHSKHAAQRSMSEPLQDQLSPIARKPTSSSWIRWWNRNQSNRDKEASHASGKGTRPIINGSASAPSEIIELPRRNLSMDIRKAETEPGTPIGNASVGTTEGQPRPGAVVSALDDATMRKKKYAKTLRLTSHQLKSLNLKDGANTITFSLSELGAVACTARIFVWDATDLILVSDIDGTITKSDGLGHIFTMIGRDWTHLGVAKLYTDIARNGYKIMYLTSRAIGQADSTREYLKGIKQNDYQLPEGPVIMSPDRLMAALHREVVMRKPEVFKMACLRDIQRLFGEASRNPFYAGFGNRITDALSYRSVNVPSARIFTIDSTGEVKMELLELAGYKSSYIHMTDLVDQMFPPIHRKWAPEFTDFNYWKTPVQDFALPDLAPPSPTLSARSDTSNRSALARIRNFSLVSSRSNSTKHLSLPSSIATGGRTSPVNGTDNNAGDRRSQELRQMTSFERLSNMFSQSSNLNRRSLSPGSVSSSSLTYLDSGSDNEGNDDDMDDEKRYRRERTASITSMPGSLDDEGGGDLEEGYGYEGEEEDGLENEEEAAEEAFDEDFLATGEMKNVPFL